MIVIMPKGKVCTDREQRTRRKLVTSEMHPLADFLLSVIIWWLWPVMWLFGKVHDKIMFKFLNKAYIYNVSWEVRDDVFGLSVISSKLSPCFPGPQNGPQGI